MHRVNACAMHTILILASSLVAAIMIAFTDGQGIHQELLPVSEENWPNFPMKELAADPKVVTKRESAEPNLVWIEKVVEPKIAMKREAAATIGEAFRPKIVTKREAAATTEEAIRPKNVTKRVAAAAIEEAFRPKIVTKREAAAVIEESVGSDLMTSYDGAGEELVGYTDGKEAVVWKLLRRSAERTPRAGGRYYNNDVSCMVHSVIPYGHGTPLTLTRRLVKRSVSEFGADREMCLSHSRRKRMIMAGTKWCGAGNKASNYNDLGWYAEEDKCCRDHDLCPKFVEGLDSKYNVTNYSALTWSDCECDEVLRKCFQGLNTYMANSLGFMFFDILTNMKCLRFSDYDMATAVDKGPYKRPEETGGWFSSLIGWFG